VTRKTTIVTDCGHQYNRGYTADQLTHCTMACRVCGELLIIPRDEIETRFPQTWEVVRARLFHRWVHDQDPGWPADGAGTEYVEFDVVGAS